MTKRAKKTVAPEEKKEEPEVPPPETEDAADVEASAESEHTEEEGEAKTEGKRKKKRRHFSESDHPPTTDMIREALMDLGDVKKGSTIQAIKSHIMANNTVHTERLSSMMRKALPKLLEKETISRPKGQENASLMTGRYRLTPGKVVNKEAARARPASLRRLAVDGGIIKKKPKKKKRKSRFY